MSADEIVRLEVTLDEVEPPVLRRIEVPLAIRLDRLHSALQAAIGWTDSHLYEIRVRDVRWGVPDPDWGDGPLDARKARLIDVLEETGAKTLSSTSTISATAGSTRSRSSASPRRCRASHTRA